MRKSMIALFVILGLTAASLTWMLGWMTDLIRPELDASSEWTHTYSSSLAPKAKIGVVRVPGGRDRPFSDTEKHGLFVSVPLSAETWDRPGAAEGVAVGVARAAFERFG